MSTKDYFGVFASALCVAYLFLLLWRMSRLVRPVVSFWQMLIAGPLLFLSPERYFREGQYGAPWRYMLWWVLGSTTILLVAARIQKMDQRCGCRLTWRCSEPETHKVHVSWTHNVMARGARTITLWRASCARVLRASLVAGRGT